MKIEIDSNEAKQMITEMLARAFPDIIIEDFTYNDWAGIVVNARTKNQAFRSKMLESEFTDFPLPDISSAPPPAPAPRNDDPPDDIPF